MCSAVDKLMKPGPKHAHCGGLPVQQAAEARIMNHAPRTSIFTGLPQGLHFVPQKMVGGFTCLEGMTARSC
jgi:hypothetical protein